MTEVTVISEPFEATVAGFARAVALSFDGAFVTKGKLNRRAHQIARSLRRKGVGPGGCVCGCLSPGPELFTVLLAALKASVAYGPMDPNDPAERLQQIFEASRASMVICDTLRRPGLDSNLRCFLDIAERNEKRTASQRQRRIIAYVRPSRVMCGNP